MFVKVPIQFITILIVTIDGNVRYRRRFDWQLPGPTTELTYEPTTAAAKHSLPAEVSQSTESTIYNAKDVINAEDEANEDGGIGDVGLILWAANGKKPTKQREEPTDANVMAILAKVIETEKDISRLELIGKSILDDDVVVTAGPVVMVIPSEPTSTESNLKKIMNRMPSANEDMIRVVKLKEDERYGKGKAKPKYISMVLAKMNSTEYDDEVSLVQQDEQMEETTIGGTSATEEVPSVTMSMMETRSDYSVSISA